jgi:hypothetical protein
MDKFTCRTTEKNECINELGKCQIIVFKNNKLCKIANNLTCSFLPKNNCFDENTFLCTDLT